MLFTEIAAKEAFELLKSDPISILIDVRTDEEFRFVGTADASSFGNRMITLPWQTLPNMVENSNFGAKLTESLQQIFGNNSTQAKLIFICRSGARSAQAANFALMLGYKNCYNLLNGFEGDLDQNSHRGKINGWKAENLPWRQK